VYRAFTLLTFALVGFGGCRCGAASQQPPVVIPAPDASVDAADAQVARSEPSSSEETIAAIVVDEFNAYWFAKDRELVTQKPNGEGSPAVFARASKEPVALGLDAKRVYWIDDGGELVAALRTDGTKQVLAKLTRPRGLVLDGQSALVVADDGGDTSAIFRVALDGADGGPPKKVAVVPVSTMTLAVDATSIFVVAEDVLRIPKTGGTAKKISASPEPAAQIVLVREDIVFVGLDPQAMTGRVWSMPKRGPPPAPKRAAGDDLSMVMYAGAIPLSAEDGTAVALATDGHRPFWITAPSDPDVKTASLQMASDKGKDEPTEIAKVPSTSGVAVFRSRLYWSTAGGVKSLPAPP
jgi:hypothetical protein